MRPAADGSESHARRHDPAAADLRRGRGPPELRAHVRAAAPHAGGGLAADQAARGASPGFALFERRGRKLHLTEAGEHLRPLRAADPRRAEGRRTPRSRRCKGLRGGRISVGVVSTAKYFAPALLARFQQRHPGVRVTLSVNNREVIVRELERNEIDVAIMGTPPQRIETEGGAVRRPSAGHHRAAGASARARAADPARGARRRALPGARAGLGHALVDGALFRRARLRAEDRQRDEQQRDDQAGGDGRHGARAHLAAHDRPRARRPGGWSSSTSPGCR